MQGGKGESDRWGVLGLADLPSLRGNMEGEGAEEKEVALLTAPTAITRGGTIPLIPMQLNRCYCGRHTGPLSSASDLTGPNWIPAFQLPKGGIRQYLRLSQDRERRMKNGDILERSPRF